MDRDNEYDYIRILKTIDIVKDMAKAITEVTKTHCRHKYFTIDEKEYGFPLTEEYLDIGGSGCRVLSFFGQTLRKKVFALFSALTNKK